jgi:hypothetical protein
MIFNLEEFLRNPENQIADINTRIKTLEEVQPIILFIDETNYKSFIDKFSEALTIRGIEFHINPRDIETPVRGYSMHITNSDKLIY